MARGETTLPTTGFTRLSLRIKVLLLAVVPLVILAGVIMLASMQLEREANAQRAVLEQSLLATKEKELRLLLDLAFAAIKPIMDDTSLNTEQQQEAVKRLFNKRPPTSVGGRLVLLLGAAVLSLVVLAFWVNWQDSRWAERHLQQLVHNFVQLQVEERRGFARELHDGINQLLVAVRFRIELAPCHQGFVSKQVRLYIAKA